MVVFWIKTVLLENLASMVNVLILAKNPSVVDHMLFAKQVVIEQSANVKRDTKELRQVKDVSKQDVKVMLIVLQTNGVTKADVKTHVPILELVEPMPNVVSCTIMHYVLVQLGMLEILGPSVSLISMNA